MDQSKITIMTKKSARFERRGEKRGIVTISKCRWFTFWLLACASFVFVFFQTSSLSSKLDTENRHPRLPLFWSLYISIAPHARCLKMSIRNREPDSEKYQHQSLNLNGTMFAYYHWNEPFQKSQIDFQKLHSRLEGCKVVFKIIRSQLFVYKRNSCYDAIQSNSISRIIAERYVSAVELILLAIEIYDIPDVDFVMGFGDTVDPVTMNGHLLPVLSYNIKSPIYGEKEIKYKISVPTSEKGFTFPSYLAYDRSLGPVQVKSFCLFFKDWILDVSFPYMPSQEVSSFEKRTKSRMERNQYRKFDSKSRICLPKQKNLIVFS